MGLERGRRGVHGMSAPSQRLLATTIASTLVAAAVAASSVSRHSKLATIYSRMLTAPRVTPSQVSAALSTPTCSWL